jgi:hypothetical protein
LTCNYNKFTTTTKKYIRLIPLTFSVAVMMISFDETG